MLEGKHGWGRGTGGRETVSMMEFKKQMQRQIMLALSCGDKAYPLDSLNPKPKP